MCDALFFPFCYIFLEVLPFVVHAHQSFSLCVSTSAVFHVSSSSSRPIHTSSKLEPSSFYKNPGTTFVKWKSRLQDSGFKPVMLLPLSFPPWTFSSILFSLFICLFIAAWAIFQLSGGCHHYRWQGCKFRPMFGAQGLWVGRDLFPATSIVTWDLGFYGLIQKTSTHVPQWDFDPLCKDHQIQPLHHMDDCDHLETKCTKCVFQMSR